MAIVSLGNISEQKAKNTWSTAGFLTFHKMLILLNWAKFLYNLGNLVTLISTIVNQVLLAFWWHKVTNYMNFPHPDDFIPYIWTCFDSVAFEKSPNPPPIIAPVRLSTCSFQRNSSAAKKVVLNLDRLELFPSNSKFWISPTDYVLNQRFFLTPLKLQPGLKFTVSYSQGVLKFLKCRTYAQSLLDLSVIYNAKWLFQNSSLCKLVI